MYLVTVTPLLVTRYSNALPGSTLSSRLVFVSFDHTALFFLAMNVTVHQSSSCGITTGFPETLRSQRKKYDNNASWRTSRKFLAQSFSRIQQHATRESDIRREGKKGREESPSSFPRCPSLLVNSFLSHGKGKVGLSLTLCYTYYRGAHVNRQEGRKSPTSHLELYVCRLLLSSQRLKGEKTAAVNIFAESRAKE